MLLDFLLHAGIRSDFKLFSIRANGLTSQPPLFSLHGGLYRCRFINCQKLKIVRGNKLFLCLLLRFNECKHTLLNNPAKLWLLKAKKTKVMTSIECDKMADLIIF